MAVILFISHLCYFQTTSAERNVETTHGFALGLCTVLHFNK